MAAIETARRHYTLPEFLARAGDLELAGSDDWYEIIQGELVAHASPNHPHMRAGSPASVCSSTPNGRAMARPATTAPSP